MRELLKSKKSLITFLIIFITALSLNAATINAESMLSAGLGTAENPYKISTAEEFRLIRMDLTGHYVLMNDIDLENELFTPIGSYKQNLYFTGSLDGNGYTVKNVNIKKVEDFFTAIFSMTKNATIKNLTIENINVDGWNSTAGLIGRAENGTFSNLHLIGEGLIEGNTEVGSLASSASNSTFNNCSNSISVKCATAGAAGLIYRIDRGTVKQCYTTCDVNATSAAGLIATITGHNQYVFQTYIDECFTSGNITGQNIGGLFNSTYLVTSSQVVVSNCYSVANLTHTADYWIAGGLIGDSIPRITLNNCYFGGKMSGTKLFGITQTLTNVVSKSIYFDSQRVNSQDPTHGKLTSAMLAQSTFKDWDFEAIWAIDEGSSYPYLRNLPKPDQVVIKPVETPATGITLSPGDTLIPEGQSSQYRYKFTPEGATRQNVTFTSSNESVATIDQNGYLQALKEGETIITVTSEKGLTANSYVTVFRPGEPEEPEEPEVPVEGISLCPTSSTLTVGDGLQLNPTIFPTNATNKKIIWNSSDSSVATVDENGNVTAVGPGYAAIVALTESGLHMAFCNLIVEDGTEPIVSVESVSVAPEAITMEIGDTSELFATVTPSDAANKAVLWESDAPDVAAVDAFGKVTAVASGVATITATTVDGNFTAICVVTVNEEVPEIPVNLALDAVASANSESSSTFKASKANDGATNTRWLAKSNTSDIYLELDFKKDVTFSKVNISEFDDRVSSYAIQAWDGTGWIDVYTGDAIGKNFAASFNSVTSSKVRLMMYTTNTTYGASIWEFEVYK